MGFKKASRQSVGRRTPCEDSSSKSVSVEKLSGLKGMNHPWHITFCQIHILICHSQQSWEESLFWTPLKRCRNQDSSEGVAEGCQAAGPDFFFIFSKYMNRVLVPSHRQQGKTPICSCYTFLPHLWADLYCYLWVGILGKPWEQRGVLLTYTTMQKAARGLQPSRDEEQVSSPIGLCPFLQMIV